MRAARPPLAVTLGLLALVVAVTLTVTLHREREGYTNQTPNRGPGALLQPGETVCQRGELVPRDARTFRFYAGTDEHAAGPIELTIAQPGHPTLRGRTEKPFRTGPVTISLGPHNPPLPSASVCLHNPGRYGISIGGSATGGLRRRLLQPQAGLAVVGGRPQTGRMTIEYPDGARRVSAMLGEVARRAGLVKASIIGPWALWFALALTTLATGWSIVLVLREGQR